MHITILFEYILLMLVHIMCRRWIIGLSYDCVKKSCEYINMINNDFSRHLFDYIFIYL